MEMEFSWDRPVIEIVAEKTGGKEGMLFLASEAARLMEPYVPADNLVLSQNIRITAEESAGHVTYNSPYAHYQYEGILYVDPKYKVGCFTDGENFWSRPGVAKIPTDRHLEHQTFRHPLATSKWDKAMMTARKSDLMRAFEDYLRRKT